MITRSKALFARLEKNRVKYVIIGGVAAILHGVPRMTGDIDIFIEPGPENARRMLNALGDLGWANKQIQSVDDQKFYIISKSDLIASKLASGRKKDLDDVAALTTK
jgi:hypothetical protein